jgi:hypothetical protein
MDAESEKRLEEIAKQQKLNQEATKAQYEADRLIATKRLADCLEDAKAAWKEAFWEEDYRSVASGGRYSVEPAPEALSLLAFRLYESRHSG